MNIPLTIYIILAAWLAAFGISTVFGRYAAEESWGTVVKVATLVWGFGILIFLLVWVGILLANI